jgi:hypothetical protein
MSASTVEQDFGLDLAQEALETRIHSRTGRRLRYLTIEFIAGRTRISALAPSYHVRQLAEQAALDLLPADQVELDVHVLPQFPPRIPR